MQHGGGLAMLGGAEWQNRNRLTDPWMMVQPPYSHTQFTNVSGVGSCFADSSYIRGERSRILVVKHM